MNYLIKHDYIIKHHLYKANIIGLANKISRISKKYNQLTIIKDSEKIIIILISFLLVISLIRNHARYRESK